MVSYAAKNHHCLLFQISENFICCLLSVIYVVLFILFISYFILFAKSVHSSSMNWLDIFSLDLLSRETNRDKQTIIFCIILYLYYHILLYHRCYIFILIVVAGIFLLVERAYLYCSADAVFINDIYCVSVV